MSQNSPSVTLSDADLARLPDWSSAGCTLIAALRQRGALAAIGDRLRIQREGGFAGLDILLVLLFFFSARLGRGFRPFWTRASPFALQLGAVAGRRGLPSPASVSRALESVEAALLRPQITWLLGEVTQADEVLRHPAVLARDALGQGWHVFHYDPTGTVLRQRALPEGEDLPSGRRRAKRLAVPGYHGRKRGEICFRRNALEHGGSGLWLHATLSKGSGSRDDDLAATGDAVVQTCARLGHPLTQALFVTDGEFAGVPSLTLLRGRNLPFLTRCVRYDLLEQPEIQHRLSEAVWEEVPDDRSGPRRSATDLGIVTITPGLTTLRPDGSPYAPILVRVVVSRYIRTEKAEHGRVVDGWQYELFSADLDPVAWPASDVVHTFFSRAAQENRFAQEDKELGLDRVLSHELPGQEFASVVGLFVWNLRLVQGFLAAPPPLDEPAQVPRVAHVDARPVPVPPSEEPEAVEPEELEEAGLPGAMQARLIRQLSGIDWQTWQRKNPGWKWVAATGEVTCPQQKSLPLLTITLQTPRPTVRPQVCFRTPLGTCDACPVRADCTSAKPGARKTVGVSVDQRQAKQIKKSFYAARPHRRTPAKPPQRRRPRLAVQLLDHARPSGPYRLALPLFLPAAARALFDVATLDLTVRVTVSLPTTRRQHALVAADRARRQHRRLTWTEHLARYALPDGAHVAIEYARGPRARALDAVLAGGAAA